MAWKWPKLTSPFKGIRSLLRGDAGTIGQGLYDMSFAKLINPLVDYLEEPLGSTIPDEKTLQEYRDRNVQFTPEHQGMSDILGFEKEGGENELMKYLSDLLLSSGVEPATSRLIDEDKGIGSFLESSDASDWLNLGADDLSKYLAENLPHQGSILEGMYLGTQEIKPETLQFFQKLQEGYKGVGTTESLGLNRKLGDIQGTAQRGMESARRGYAPVEALTRYGALQGKPGMQAKGELEESRLESDIYGIQRGAGRDVRGAYKQFESDWFDKAMRILNLG